MVSFAYCPDWGRGETPAQIFGTFSRSAFLGGGGLNSGNARKKSSSFLRRTPLTRNIKDMPPKTKISKRWAKIRGDDGGNVPLVKYEN